LEAHCSTFETVCSHAVLGCVSPCCQTGVQDFVLCIEMFIAAVAHYYAFPVAPYADGSIQTLLREARERGRATSEVKHRMHSGPDSIKPNKKLMHKAIDELVAQHMARPEVDPPTAPKDELIGSTKSSEPQRAAE
jgi:hypothetical protein